MERQKQSVIDGSIRSENGGPETVSGSAPGTAPNAASTPRPRDSGHYVCSFEGGATPFAIPRALQLFAGAGPGRNIIWGGAIADGVSQGSHEAPLDQTERPPPALC